MLKFTKFKMVLVKQHGLSYLQIFFKRILGENNVRLTREPDGLKQ